MNTKDEAVSPVVGVMLMLVVTIIIAAVVSAFAGGLSEDTSKPAQVSIQAEYSQTYGLTITHMGGDVINTLNTKIYVAPTADFGSYDQLRWEVNTTAVMIDKNEGDKSWFNPAKTSSYSARTFQPGETAVVEYGDEITVAEYSSSTAVDIDIGKTLGQVQPQTYQTYTSEPTDSADKYYGFQHPNAVGQRFILSLVDEAGRTIAQTEVQIEP